MRGFRETAESVWRRVLVAEAGCELGEQRRADADDDSEHQDLDAGGDDVAENTFGHEGGFAEEAERDQHEAGERRQLEFNQRDEELDGEDEESEQHQRPGQEHAGDLDEVLEKRPIAHEVGDGVGVQPRYV